MLKSLGAQDPSIRAIFCAPHDNPPRYALMITAYLDESQQTETERHVVVAGFCGNEEQWNAFLPKWREALKPRTTLHMNSIRWNRKGAKRDIPRFLARLAPIPYESGLVPVYGSVRVADYYDLIRNESRLEQRLKGFHVCLGVILSVLMHRYPAEERINVVLEAQGRLKYWELSKALFRAFQQTSGPQYPYFETIRNVRKGETAFTEPADFLAFAVGKSLDENGSKKDRWCKQIHPKNYKLANRYTLAMPRNMARALVRQASGQDRNILLQQLLADEILGGNLMLHRHGK